MAWIYFNYILIDGLNQLGAGFKNVNLSFWIYSSINIGNYSCICVKGIIGVSDNLPAKYFDMILQKQQLIIKLQDQEADIPGVILTLVKACINGFQTPVGD